MSEVPRCRDCEDDLTDENWYLSLMQKNNRICKTCQHQQRKIRNIKKGIAPRKCPPFDCRVCGTVLTDDNWTLYAQKTHNNICRGCANNYSRLHNGCLPLGKNKTAPLYLGVHVAEQVLSNVFKNVERMPYNNPGFDFVCNNGYMIDVKSSCKTKRDVWTFHIGHNTRADYFLCLAFDNIDDLNPLNMWLIPGSKVSNKYAIYLKDIHKNKWSK